MYSEINQQLEKAQQGIYRLKKIDSMLHVFHEEERTLEGKVSELKEVLEKEDQDILRLENRSLANIFYSFLGSIDERVEKERQESLAAKLKYEQAVNALENIKHEILKLNRERKNYKDSIRTYENLFNKKKELLILSDLETAESVLCLTKQYEMTKNNLKEIQEAIVVGGNVLQYVDYTLESLKSAQGWGVWDMIGGGLITDLIKHTHIDEAKRMAEKTQMLLFRFKAELADVRVNQGIHIEMEGFAKFADFFFDGLIADWVMQSKIHASKASVLGVQEQVQSVIEKLKEMEKKESEYLHQMEREMNEMIIYA